MNGDKGVAHLAVLPAGDEIVHDCDMLEVVSIALSEIVAISFESRANGRPSARASWTRRRHNAHHAAIVGGVGNANI